MPKRTASPASQAAAAQAAAVLESHDPASLLADRNVRLDPRLDRDFIDSVGEFGVLQPLVGFRTGDGQVRVKMGHRRRLAAIEKGVAPVLVVVYPTEADTPEAGVERILAQLSENEDRTGLTTVEIAKAVQDALDLGLPEADLRRRRRMSKAQVAAARAVATSETAAGAAASHEFLTLDQAAGLAEFEAAPEAVERLLAAASRGEGSFVHVLQQLRDTRAEQALAAAKRAELEAGGVTVLDENPGWSREVSSLYGEDGTTLFTPETHRSCPGNAAFVYVTWALPGDEGQDDDELDDDEDGPEREPEPVRRVQVARVSWYCTDPLANGHKPQFGSADWAPGRSGKPAGDPEEATAERRRVLANNKAWRSAETVRRQWLATLAARKTPPTGGLRFLIEELARGDYTLRKGLDTGHRFARTLLSLDEPSVSYGPAATSEILDLIAEGTDNRAQVIALALVLGSCEAATGVHTWRQKGAAAERYFTALKAWGYPLSDVELLVLSGPDSD